MSVASSQCVPSGGDVVTADGNGEDRGEGEENGCVGGV